MKDFIQHSINLLMENKLDNLKNPSIQHRIMGELGIENYSIIGEGQHGIVFRISENECLKLTTSSQERDIIIQAADK